VVGYQRFLSSIVPTSQNREFYLNRR